MATYIRTEIVDNKPKNTRGRKRNSALREQVEQAIEQTVRKYARQANMNSRDIQNMINMVQAKYGADNQQIISQKIDPKTGYPIIKYKTTYVDYRKQLERFKEGGTIDRQMAEGGRFWDKKTGKFKSYLAAKSFFGKESADYVKRKFEKVGITLGTNETIDDVDMERTFKSIVRNNSEEYEASDEEVHEIFRSFNAVSKALKYNDMKEAKKQAELYFKRDFTDKEVIELKNDLGMSLKDIRQKYVVEYNKRNHARLYEHGFKTEFYKKYGINPYSRKR